MIRTIRAQYSAGYTDYDGLATYRVMPTRNVPIDAMDPFLFLNHHGPQHYKPSNEGLPFAPHPHKGFETVTFIMEGDLIHMDSTGYNSTIYAGGIQWMTAGKGIIHSETSSELFKEKGGDIELLQLWINLPASLKNVEPAYKGLQKNEIPEVLVGDGKGVIHIISGEWNGVKGALQSLSGVNMATLSLKKGAVVHTTAAPDKQILCYIIKGNLTINGVAAETYELVEFNKDGEDIKIEADEDSTLLFGSAYPTHEPVAAHGPFVMNTQEEIRQAFLDYQHGKFGVWNH